jgi:hypothetical protein
MHRLALIVLALFLVSCGNAYQVGDTRHIQHTAFPQVPVAVDDAAYTALTQALAAKDSTGLGDLLLTGKVLAVNQQTQVKILVVDGAKAQVRILDGEHLGKSGWVPVEYIAP